MAGKATVTDAEAAVFEKKNKDDEAKYDGKADNPIADSLGSGGTGGYNALFVDHGTELARVDGVKRTSLISIRRMAKFRRSPRRPGRATRR